MRNQSGLTISQNQKKTKEDKRVQKAIDMFGERVTIAGVEDVHKSKIRAEKWMFVLALVAAIGGMIFTSTSIASKYLKHDTTFDHFPIAGYQPPFPNVSVCIPLSVNQTLFKQLMVVPVKIRNLIKRKNLDLQAIIDFTLEFWRYDRYQHIVTNELVARASFEIMQATVMQFPNGYIDLLFKTYPRCDQILSSCFFYDQPFNCCQAAQFVFAFDSICYHIELSRVPDFQNTTLIKGGISDDPIKLETTGLVINVSLDRSMASFFEDTAKDGLLVAVGPIPTDNMIPVAIPASADALIMISATKEQELSDCYSIGNLPKLEYFDYYDSYGLLLYYDTGVRQFLYWSGCDTPLITHMPQSQNTTCLLNVLHFVKTTYALDEMQILKGGDNKINAAVMNSNAKGVAQRSLPTCNRWDYEIKAASYGYVQNRGRLESEPERTQVNKPWTRIRIYFASASYLYRVERRTDPFYVAMCDVGGAMSVYIGVSMISFVQLTVYGLLLVYAVGARCYKRRCKRNRVGVL